MAVEWFLMAEVARLSHRRLVAGTDTAMQEGRPGTIRGLAAQISRSEYSLKSYWSGERSNEQKSSSPGR